MKLLVTALFLCFSFAIQANGQPDFLSDPDPLDPEFPPAMNGGAIDVGGTPVNAIVYMANGRGPHPTVILLHGFPGNEKNLDLAQAIRRVGWNVVFFHYRGSWGSAGSYSLKNANEDVAAVLEFVRTPDISAAMRIDPSRIALIGHSFGGFFAYYGAVNNPNIRCVGGIANYDIGGYAKYAKANDLELWPWFRERQILNGFNRSEAIADINAHIEEYHVLNYSKRLNGIKSLLVAPEWDGAWLLENQQKMAESWAAAGVDVTYISIPGADHSFSGRRIRLMEVITGWLNGPCLEQSSAAAWP